MVALRTRRTPTWLYTLGCVLALGGCAGSVQDFSAAAADTTANATGATTAGNASTDENEWVTVVADSNATTAAPVGGVFTSALTMPLQGCNSAGYTAQVRLGQATSFQMIVDTGSATLAVAAATCSNCSGVSPTYTPAPEATDGAPATGGAYGNGSSWSGDVFSDEVSVGGGNGVGMAFAAIEQQTISRSSGHGVFNASGCSGQAAGNAFQGIIGFGGNQLAVANTDSFLDKLHAQSAMADVFATQFCDLGGNLWLGGYDYSASSATPVYTPMNTATGFYEIEVTGLQLGEASMGAQSVLGTAIVDTGTSAMIVNSEIFETLNTALNINALFRFNFGLNFLRNGNCVTPPRGMSRSSLDSKLPQMVLQFPDANNRTVSITLPATESYLMAMIQADGSLGYCPGATSGGGSNGLPNLVLGNSILHSQIAIFDRANQRFGLVSEVGCGHLQTLAK